MSSATTKKKIIQIGPNSQARIAQACDRCRTKKIRCDGVVPRCSQCTLVGLECKTSHTLSRRAFPKGYTESLENHVRELEAQVVQLKNDADVLSRMLLRSSQPVAQLPSPTKSPETSEAILGKSETNEQDDVVFKAPSLVSSPGSDHSDDVEFVGKLCVKIFIAALNHAIEESGRTDVDVDAAIERFGLLLQGLRSETRSELMNENQKVIRTTISILNKLNVPGAVVTEAAENVERTSGPQSIVRRRPSVTNVEPSSPLKRPHSSATPRPVSKEKKLKSEGDNPGQQRLSASSQMAPAAQGTTSQTQADWSSLCANLQRSPKPRTNSESTGLNLDYLSFESDAEAPSTRRVRQLQMKPEAPVFDLDKCLDDLLESTIQRTDSCYSATFDDVLFESPSGLELRQAEIDSVMDDASPMGWHAYPMSNMGGADVKSSP